MATRSKLIQLVHIGAAKLFPGDDDARRDWQQQHTGKTSCRDMDDRQLEDLVKILKAKKALNTKPPKRAGRVPFNRSPYMRKIEAMLAEMELSWQYAEGIAWRLTGGHGKKTVGRPGVQRLEFVKQRKHFEGIIAALEKEQTKRRLLKAIHLNLEALSLDEVYVRTLIAGKPYAHNWQRNLALLDMIAEHLADKWEQHNAAQ